MADGAKVRTVADVMTLDVLTTSASELLAKASSRMIERKVGSVIVVDDGGPVGILTERDLVRATAAGADLSTALVSEWMTASADTSPWWTTGASSASSPCGTCWSWPRCCGSSTRG
jgi:CBS domain-containing protein